MYYSTQLLTTSVNMGSCRLIPKDKIHFGDTKKTPITSTGYVCRWPPSMSDMKSNLFREASPIDYTRLPD